MNQYRLANPNYPWSAAVHLKSLRIENFRALQDFTVSKLGRVNLIVGKNNSGKSSVLEALRIYAHSANPTILEDIAIGHDEKFRMSEIDLSKDAPDLPFESFFTGRTFPLDDDTPIYIGECEKELGKGLYIEHLLFKVTNDTVDEEGETRIIKRRKSVSKYSAYKNGEDFDEQTISIRKGESYRVFNINIPTPRNRSRMWTDHIETLPCSYVPTQFISMDELASIWDEVQFNAHGDFVKDGLKVISDDIENLAFVNNDSETYTNRYSAFNNYQSPPQRLAKVKLKGTSKAVSLNSMGDGVLRMLQLLLKTYPAQGGILLIDEFENGLHYSVQEKIWRYLFELAHQLNIQVFATSHSWDCIESFSKVAIERIDIEGVMFRVGRSIRTSDNGKIIATEFSEEQLLNITQSDVEVR